MKEKEHREIVERLATIEEYMRVTNGMNRDIYTRLAKKVGKKEFYWVMGLMSSLLTTTLGFMLYHTVII